VVSVYLALVIFTKLDTAPPQIVAAFKTLDACLDAAGSRNRPIAAAPPPSGSWYVCLQMRGDA
jgi:hypothetical protein